MDLCDRLDNDEEMDGSATCMSNFIKCSESCILLEAENLGLKSLPKAREPLKVVGRLTYFIKTWKMLTRGTWVLNTIEGY